VGVFSYFPDAHAIISYYPQALAVAATVAVWFSGRSTYRKDLAESIREASAAWREVADARKQRIDELTLENAALKQEIMRLRAPRKIGVKP